MSKKLLLATLALTCGLALVFSAAAGEETTRAVAIIHPTEGNDVEGMVSFEKVRGGVRVTVDLQGLDPGPHGFHIHQYGDCSASDATSAGGHYNPEGTPHGGPGDPPSMRHVGDLGNVTADSRGVVRVEMVDAVISLDGAHSIIGRAVVVHAGEDDLRSQPSGAAGARVACGVIGIDE